jgi:Domain of unknown function (DUF5680)
MIECVDNIMATKPKTKFSEAKFAQFLEEAIGNSSYASLGNVKRITQPDGTKVIGPYTNGGFTYVDKYTDKGLNEFRGTEEVLLGERQIWKREYKGTISDPAHATEENSKELYEFLKEALREGMKTLPAYMRGLDGFSRGEYTYVCKHTGDIKSFRGDEMIIVNRRIVYSLKYSGGFV